MVFNVENGPECTMHFECSILDAYDNVLFSDPAHGDFHQPATEVGDSGDWSGGAWFNLTDEQLAMACEREHGYREEIKLRMVVHLYLPDKAPQGGDAQS
jgi:hypothetical protein